jgi:hypothetical protein
MSKNVYMEILHGVREYANYFKVKCTITMMMLAYGSPADSHDDYLRMSESTGIEYMYRCRGGKVWQILFERPNEATKIMTRNAPRQFPRMLGSINCMHW